MTVLILEYDRLRSDLDYTAEKEEFETVLFQLIFKRLLDPVLDAALFRIGVLPVRTKYRQRRLRTFLG